MASAVLTKYKDVVAADGNYLRPYECGPNLLDSQVALTVLERMMNEPLAVVGGDIWIVRGERYEIRADWFCERMPAESAVSFARRSIETAVTRLNQASQQHSDGVFVDLVVKDAITGEPLPRN